MTLHWKQLGQDVHLESCRLSLQEDGAGHLHYPGVIVPFLFPGAGKADALGLLSVDLGLSQPLSDFCQKTVDIGSQRVQTLEAEMREWQLFAQLGHIRCSLKLANDPAPELAAIIQGIPRLTATHHQVESHYPQRPITLRERKQKKKEQERGDRIPG